MNKITNLEQIKTVLGKLQNHREQVRKQEHVNPIPATGFSTQPEHDRIMKSRTLFTMPIYYYSIGVNGLRGIEYPSHVIFSMTEGPLLQEAFIEALNDHQDEILHSMRAYLLGRCLELEPQPKPQQPKSATQRAVEQGTALTELLTDDEQEQEQEFTDSELQTLTEINSPTFRAQ